MEPRLRPSRTGVDLLLPKARDYYAGTAFRWIAGVGARLRAERPEVKLEVNFGNGGWKTAASRRSFVDGVAVLRARLKRNARFRVRVKGSKPSRSVKLFAYPRFDFDVRRTSDTRGAIDMRVSGVSGRTLAAHRAYGYIGSAAKRTFTRLGSGGLRSTGKVSAKASIPFRLLRRVGPNDVIAVCVGGLPKAGYGRDVGLAGHCGAGKVAYPPKKHRLGRWPSTACARPAPAARSRKATSPVACAPPAARRREAPRDLRQVHRLG